MPADQIELPLPLPYRNHGDFLQLRVQAEFVGERNGHQRQRKAIARTLVESLLGRCRCRRPVIELAPPGSVDRIDQQVDALARAPGVQQCLVQRGRGFGRERQHRVGRNDPAVLPGDVMEPFIVKQIGARGKLRRACATGRQGQEESCPGDSRLACLHPNWLLQHVSDGITDCRLVRTPS